MLRLFWIFPRILSSAICCASVIFLGCVAIPSVLEGTKHSSNELKKNPERENNMNRCNGGTQEKKETFRTFPMLSWLFSVALAVEPTFCVWKQMIRIEWPCIYEVKGLAEGVRCLRPPTTTNDPKIFPIWASQVRSMALFTFFPHVLSQTTTKICADDVNMIVNEQTEQ